MSATLRKPSGCWTCRLRRKKCDGARPVCQMCTALGITCHSEVDKPDWMDGGTKQQEMVERLKTQVRTGSSSRRERRVIEDGRNFIIFSEDDYADKSSVRGQRAQSRDGYAPPEAADGRATPNEIQSTDRTCAHPMDGSQLNQPLPNPEADRQGSNPMPLMVSFPRAWEMDFIAMYLDYVFPFLFPFYHPPLAGTGRAWLLSFLRHNDAIYHSVISLSSYFFTIGLSDAHPGKHNECKSLVWDQVAKQADLSFGMIQRDLAEASRSDAETTLLGKTRLMESIIQMLIFESFLGKAGNWPLHLSPALAIFEEVYKEHLVSSAAELVLLRILEGLAWPSDTDLDFGRHIWNPDQAAFRFFTADLVFLDIVAATALERAPQLATYHPVLLGDVEPEDVAVPIDLSAFVGCQNWALLAVGSIAALDARKKEATRNGSLSLPELVEQARNLSQTLDRGLSQLEAHRASRSANAKGNSRFMPYYQHARSTSADLTATATRVWAFASLIYLELVVSGWQLPNTDMQRNVDEILTAVESLEMWDHVRALAWPICVAGCVAEGGMRERAIGIVASVGDRQTSSTICEVGEIMKAVWIHRGNRGGGWDLAACLRILGSPALLI